MTQTATSPFSSENLASRGGPQWLAEARQAAFAVYQDRPVPSTKVEAWKYTNLRRFKPDDYRPAGTVEPVDSREGLPAKLRERLGASDAAGRLVLSGASVLYREVPEELLARGVIFTDLKTAVEQHGDLVRRYLYGVVPAAYPAPTQQQIERHEHIPHPAEDKFTALNAAFWENGVFVYVPRNVALELPLGGFR
jgi:Fe-S cluster assembly protein SufD